MKLAYSPASPFARKIRIAAMELGLFDRIEFIVPIKAIPVTENEEYARNVSPLRKIPALILDSGQVIVDSYVIAEYLDELGGGKLIPASGPAKWQAKTEHSILQGMLDALLLCRYERMLRPKELLWTGWADDQFKRAWDGLARYEAHPDVLTRPLDIVQIGIVCVLGYLDFRFPDCGWRKTFPKLDSFHEKMMQRDSVKSTVPPPA
ncbi:glutathione S-transferase family protein [Afipia sp. DC4300-2b1]|uniref:glutathione S-transferase family protein n=1 Tax=Afipia sp. DC4300-2b1 TaxID=2804672 RepID=UPI003CF98C5A